jgi:uncharacterized protein YndB with AHSA1/START domain
MDVNANAPVVTRDEILIEAPPDVAWKVLTDISAWPRWRPGVRTTPVEGALAVGSVFHWEEGGLRIASTVREIDPPRRLVWTGPAQGVDAIHVWRFTPAGGGVLVQTEESWEGESVQAQAVDLQALLDAAIRAWLTDLKIEAEEA